MAETTNLSIITLNVNGLNTLIKRQINKNVVHIYKRILLSHKNEWDLTVCDNRDGSRGHYAKWNQSDRESKHHMISLTCGIWKTKWTNKTETIS